MPYSLPSMDQLRHFVTTLDVEYQKKRKQIADSNSFIWNLVSSEDPMRQADIQFIQLVTASVTASKTQYAKWDRFFRDQRFISTLPFFMEYVIAGALFYTLIRISNSYSDENKVKNSSALATLLFDFFNVDKLSDIPVDELRDSLKILLRYLDNVPKGLGLSDEAIHWHKLRPNDELIDGINSLISTVDELYSSLECH